MSKYTPTEIKEHDTSRPFHKNGHTVWIPARPLNYMFVSWWQRAKHAWGVLTGKYDVLDWEHD